MEQNSELTTRNCFTWRTRKPDPNSKQVSSPFSFLSSEWHLILSCSPVHDKRYYEIHLQKEDSTKKLKARKNFRVTTLIEEANSIVYSTDIMNGSGTIWKSDESHFFPHSLDLEWLVVCQFHSVEWRMPQEKDELIQVLDWKMSELRPDLQELSDDLSSLRTDLEFANVELKCGSETIRAHGAVLAARSGVFLNKIKHNKTGVIEVPDLEAKVLELLLKYMYSGTLEETLTEDNVISLYKASDKYAVPALKKACSDWIAKRLTVDNCVKILTMADAEGDVYLKNLVISFIIFDHEELLESEVWFRFTDEPSQLANEVYQKYVLFTMEP